MWFVRIYKTRNIAANECKKGHIIVNGNKIKASKQVFINDIIEVLKPPVKYKYIISDIPNSRLAAKFVHLYFQDITDESELEKLDILNAEKLLNKHNLKGRPTKKNRRDLNKFLK